MLQMNESRLTNLATYICLSGPMSQWECPVLRGLQLVYVYIAYIDLDTIENYKLH